MKPPTLSARKSQSGTHDICWYHNTTDGQPQAPIRCLLLPMNLVAADVRRLSSVSLLTSAATVQGPNAR